MTLSPERNDVDIKKLFLWGSKAFVYDGAGEEIISYYARLVGDADLNKARVYALRKSAEIRKKLRDSDSDERIAYIVDKDLVSEEELKNYVIILKTKSFTEEAYRNLSVPYPKEPHSEATLEEQEKYQAEVDSFQDRITETAKNKVEELIKKEQDALVGLSKDALYNKYEALAIDDICEKQMYASFRDMCAYFGSYSDESYKVRLFEDIEQFLELPIEIKEQFVRNYQNLEIDMSTLKKLRGATPL